MAWIRLKPRELCPVCGHAGWCTRTDDGKRANCQRLPNDKPIVNKSTGEIRGYLYVIDIDAVKAVDKARDLTPAELQNLQKKFTSSVHPARLKEHAYRLGVSEESLRMMRIGWNAEKNAWTFPMVNAEGRITGIRVRNNEGKKWSITGGHEGVFIPRQQQPGGCLIICEGPTSAAAFYTLGFPVIGRPSCNSGVAIIKSILKDERRAVLILADRDTPKKIKGTDQVFYPGQDGARALCEQLQGICRAKWLICPIPKDGRDWLQRGANREIVWKWIIENTAKSETRSQRLAMG